MILANNKEQIDVEILRTFAKTSTVTAICAAINELIISAILLYLLFVLFVRHRRSGHRGFDTWDDVHLKGANQHYQSKATDWHEHKEHLFV